MRLQRSNREKQKVMKSFVIMQREYAPGKKFFWFGDSEMVEHLIGEVIYTNVKKNTKQKLAITECGKVFQFYKDGSCEQLN